MSERIDPVTGEFITDEEPDTEPDADKASTPSAPENFYQDVYSFFSAELHPFYVREASTGSRTAGYWPH